MPVRLKVEGLEEAAAMARRAVKVHTRLDELRRDFTFATLASMMRLTPVRTGFLKASNVAAVSGDEIMFRAYRAYAPYVEFGTGHRGGESYKPYLPEEEGPAYATYWPGMRAQPFLRPAVADNLQILVAKLEDLASDVGEGKAA